MGIEFGKEIINIDTNLRVIYMMVKGKVLWVDASPGERTRREKKAKR